MKIRDAQEDVKYGPKHPITKKLGSMHANVQALLQEKTEKK
ncbi:MAG TPA: hypothetical protein VMY43_01200 [Methanothrix sp.]|nr:hypothetical protein [Methanothrix sp.]